MASMEKKGGRERERKTERATGITASPSWPKVEQRVLAKWVTIQHCANSAIHNRIRYITIYKIFIYTT